MLPKTSRLNLKKDFKRVASGKRIETPSLKIMYLLGDRGQGISFGCAQDKKGQESSVEERKPLVGVSMSSKVFKQAVLRNRARRIVSTGVQFIYTSLKSDLDLVIMPKVGVLKKNPLEIKEELQNVKDLYRTN